MKKTIKFYFFSLGVAGTGISGGDRIFIEFARRWSRNFPLKIFTSFEGRRLCKKQKLKGSNLKILPINNQSVESIFFLNYFYKIFAGISIAISLKLENSKDTILYSASDFWMDSLPAFILKLRYPKVTWVAAWYQTAPNPLRGYTEADRENTYKFSSLLYWLVQLPIKPLISRYSDFVLVNNSKEKGEFPDLDKRGKAVVVLGAVDLEKINNFKLKMSNRLQDNNLPKAYDAVFQGRFHPQKGVVELVNIWRKVVDKIPNAKLAMIGDGPLMQDVKLKIEKLKLENNVRLFGYLFDGDEKYKVFAKSKIVVHPAFYDSGGMAAAEAMAFGIPCVGFNLRAYRDYYPKGMVKVRKGNIIGFSDMILMLLKNNSLVKRLGREALEMIEKNWSWNQRAHDIYTKITKNDPKY